MQDRLAGQQADYKVAKKTRLSEGEARRISCNSPSNGVLHFSEDEVECNNNHVIARNKAKQDDEARGNVCSQFASCSFAFTLAEVLITLGIIGVVAALTIPTLMANYQKEQTVTKLKKSYSIISAAFKNAEMSNGSMDGWKDTSINGDTTKSKSWWEQYFIPDFGLSTIKTCQDTTFYDCISINSKWLDGAPIPWSTALPAYVLQDGTVIKLGGVYSTRATIWVDLNGLKTPNIAGKDLFLLRIDLDKRFVGFDGQGSNRTTLLSNCNKSAGANKGIYCGALIQLDEWQLKKDYPWD